MKDATRLQWALWRAGTNPGPIDGVIGDKTNAALTRWRVALGYGEDFAIGELLRQKDLPWITALVDRLGWHEKRDNARLKNWLGSHGVGVDPEDTPWCGDAVETALLDALPGVKVPEYPLASISWLKFGEELDAISYGCVLVFWRGSPASRKGHVGFYVSEDNECFHVLGGNQSNRISVSRIAKNRLRPGGIRYPDGQPLIAGHIYATPAQLEMTTNEA